MKILLVSNQGICKKMAGPAIRYFEIYKVLKEKFEVFLIAKDNDMDFYSDGIIELTIFSFIRKLIECDVVISQPTRFKYLILSRIFNKKIVIDLYDPADIENLEMYKHNNNLISKIRCMYTHLRLKFSIMIGDYFVCSNNTQRDYWIGYLSSLGRINSANYEADNKLNNIIGYLPFGISEKNNEKDKNVIKGVYEGIKESDKVIIWAGGVWNWFDTISLVKAMDRISQERNDIKLFFMGIPSSGLNNFRNKMLRETIRLSGELGLTDKTIFFNSTWADFDERYKYLLESDIGISLHYNNAETRYSFRTRILDFLWCELPFITSDNDYFAGLCKTNEIGLTVECENIEDICNNILKLIDDTELINKCKENIKRLKSELYWSNTVSDLVNYCERPYKTSGKLGRLASIFYLLFILIKIILSVFKDE